MAIELITGQEVLKIVEIASTANHSEAGNIKVILKGDTHGVWLAPKYFKPSPELESALRGLLNLEP